MENSTIGKITNQKPIFLLTHQQQVHFYPPLHANLLAFEKPKNSPHFVGEESSLSADQSYPSPLAITSDFSHKSYLWLHQQITLPLKTTPLLSPSLTTFPLPSSDPIDLIASPVKTPTLAPFPSSPPTTPGSSPSSPPSFHSKALTPQHLHPSLLLFPLFLLHL